VTGFGRLLGDLDRAGVRFVVVGGIAVIRHGVVRATKDLDVIVAPDGDTAERLSELMARWDATRPDGSAEDRRLPQPGWPLHLRTIHGLIDFLADEEPPLDLTGLLWRADERTVDGVSCPICSLADLVALKRRGGRPTDLEDLRRLEIAHGELPELPDAQQP
jgi:predicted nucleotidyltransferase